MTDITKLLHEIDQGDAAAAESLLPLVYDELRQLAKVRLSNEQPGQTLQATALVHEAYLRLVGSDSQVNNEWDGRGHFFAVAARAMQRILVENARRKKRIKAGGDRNRVDFSKLQPVAPRPNVDLLALDEALNKLEQQDKRKADLVRMRYFAGMTVEQAANALGISSSTADNDWAYAKNWLRLEINS